MNEPADGSDPARLEELAAVTREYAQFSGPSAGFASTLIGGWILGSQALQSSSPRLAELLFLLAPFVWAALASSARRFYQRHGEVIGISRADLQVKSGPMRTTMLFIVFVAALRGIIGVVEAPRGGYELAIAAYLGMAMLAVRLVRTSPWIAYAYWGVATMATLPPGPGYAWARISFGFVAVAAGVVSHLRYRRLERRLAALKERA